ncbi:MAG: indolepyruvate oxidoreductase subunit beta [Syntrophaceae bacterium]|nr:indolepyruvate oxidoreductase subunit beta [Syntrophaceae bacterium]
MKSEVKSILMAGVGGQGVLRASDILCQVMMDSGLDVKKSEVHGMAQRGGCVTSHVRYGQKVHSPLAKKGDVEILLAFEKLETLRYLDYLKPGGIVIINDEEMNPPSVNLGAAAYPETVVPIVKERFPSVIVVNAPELADRAGNRRAVNTVLLGVLSKYLKIEEKQWEKGIHDSFPLKTVEANIKAFHLGRGA